MPTVKKFRDYLVSNLPDEYPISTIPLSLAMTDAHRKELVFQQAKFLEEAGRYSEREPWISFVAAYKHLMLLEAFKTDTSTFREINDKEYFDKVQALCFNSLEQASSLLDEATMNNCKKLVHIQICHNSIIFVSHIVEDALGFGISAFEPPLNKPTFEGGYGGCGGCLAIIIGAIALGGVLGIASIDTGLIVCLILLAFGGLAWSAMTEPERVEFQKTEERYRKFCSLRDSYYSNISSFQTILSFDAKAEAINLVRCKEQLNIYISELKMLLDTYIYPYV